ncbi:MAG: Gfo/Idh/MocA family oxidoreductase [Bacteroidota bacterium]
MMQKLQYAIVGCGNIAKRHAGHIHRSGKLIAVCDIDIVKANSLAKLYQVNSYSGLADMLNNEPGIDVVVVCTPNGLHALHTITALEAKKHVLCEKPMAISVPDCLRMIEAATINQKHLFVVKQNRYNPPVAAVKQLLEAGFFGKIYSIQLNCFWNRDAAYYSNSWKGSLDLDGGTLFTQFSHFIDLVYWMFGDVDKILALTSNVAHKGIIEFEDTGVVALSFQNGMLGSIHFTVNSFHKNMEGSLTIFAEKGSVKIGGQYLNKLEYQCLDNFEIKNLPQGNLPNDYGNYQGSMSNHGKVYENVSEVLLENKPMSTLSFEALKTVEIIDKIYKAATFNNNQK